MSKRIVMNECDALIIPQLPIDLWYEIFSWMRLYEVYRLATVCSSWYEKDLAKSIKWLDKKDMPPTLKEVMIVGYDAMYQNPWPSTSTLKIGDECICRFVNLRSFVAASTDVRSTGLKGLVHLTHLDLTDHTRIYDTGLRLLTNLRSLVLGKCHITDQGLSRLTNLVSLAIDSAGYDKYVTDEGLALLTNITKLGVRDNRTITGTTLTRLCSLKHLELRSTHAIFDDDMVSLGPTLETLALTSNNNLTDKAIMALTNLTSLSLCADTLISGEAISRLTGLRSLKLDRIWKITGNAFMGLGNLKHLTITYNNTIDGMGMRYLTNLRELSLGDVQMLRNDTIGRKCLGYIGNSLTTLRLGGIVFKLNDDDLLNFPNLVHLAIPSDQTLITSNGINKLEKLLKFEMGSQVTLWKNPSVYTNVAYDS